MGFFHDYVHFYYYFRGPIATCLDDVPSNSPLPVAELVGASYDLNEQCELALGAGAQTCQSNFVSIRPPISISDICYTFFFSFLRQQRKKNE